MQNTTRVERKSISLCTYRIVPAGINRHRELFTLMRLLSRYYKFIKRPYTEFNLLLEERVDKIHETSENKLLVKIAMYSYAVMLNVSYLGSI